MTFLKIHFNWRAPLPKLKLNLLKIVNLLQNLAQLLPIGCIDQQIVVSYSRIHLFYLKIINCDQYANTVTLYKFRHEDNNIDTF